MTTRRTRGDDTGAALVLALVFVTVVALGVTALLSLAMAGQKATVATRDASAESYAAEAAADIAIEQLRTASFNGSTSGCATQATSVLPDVYPATGTVRSTAAAVRCTPDPTVSTGGGANTSPGSAILTLGTGAGGEPGIYVDSSNNESLKVNGGIFSNSTIFLSGNKSNLENVASGSYVFAKGACNSSGSSRIIATPAAVCNYANDPKSAIDRRGKDPGLVLGAGSSFDTPSGWILPGLVDVTSCLTRRVFEFYPGVYNSVAILNALTDNYGPCAGSVWHFNPGTYYFDFLDLLSPHVWSIGSGYLLGGTPTVSPLTTATVAAATGPRCVAPGTPGSSTTSGVMFVFGGDSRMQIKKGQGSNNPDAQICASNAVKGPPVAIYGLKESTPGLLGLPIAAQRGCITATGYPVGGDSGHCPLIQTFADPYPALSIFGTTYAPRAMVDVYLNNNTVQVFRWGLVVRGAVFRSTGSTGSMASPVINVPNDAPSPFPDPSQFLLEVYVCPAATTCTTSGKLRLRAKVRVSTDTPRTVTILSWAVQR